MRDVRFVYDYAHVCVCVRDVNVCMQVHICMLALYMSVCCNLTLSQPCRLDI